MVSSPGNHSPDALWPILHAFLAWLEKTGYESYDPYDLWSTRFGVQARRLYYANTWLGLPFIAPVILLDTLIPSSRSLFVKKQRFAIADAHLALAFLNLYQTTGEEHYRLKATDLCDDMLQTSATGYHGHGWGYPFDWQACDRFMPRNTPFSTTTPYCFEAFLSLFNTTQDTRYLQVAESITRFLCEDLNDTPTSETAAACSYSPIDRLKIVNASAYRAFVLFEASASTGIGDCRPQAQRNLNFVLQSQREDGSWLYAMDSPAEAFIDHFHTCFVLKNLYKLNRHLHSIEVEQAIHRGYAYYRRELFDTDGMPKSFAIEPRTQIARLELYNVAEAIALGVLLQQEIPDAFEVAVQLASQVGQHYQLRDGHFVTRVYVGGLKHTLPFIRWSQAQLFYALTTLLVAVAAKEKSVT